MNQRRRIAAILICAVAVLSILAACVAGEAAHAHHCTGENCPVCQAVARLDQLRQTLAAALLALVLAYFAPAARQHVRRASMAAVVPVAGTLVAQKIRLND